jgi:outer membrane protein TolC
MKRRNRILAVLVLLLIQHSVSRAQDSSAVLSLESFLGIVQRYHPVIRAARLDVQRAAAELQTARGAFDPTLTTALNRKEMGGKLYYSYFNPQLTVPTWYGLEFKAGVEEVSGDRVSPEATLGQTSYAGVKLSANSLLFDRRRATLQQARTLIRQSEADRQAAVNDVLFDAMAAYWAWWQAHQVQTILQNAVTVAEERMRFVAQEYEGGQRAAIDTVEALTQLQSFQAQSLSAELTARNAGLELSNYLWLENGEPVTWNENLRPSTFVPDRSNKLPTLSDFLQAADSHPKLRSYAYKLDVLSIEQRLKNQYLLPKLSVSGNILSKGYDVPSEWTTPYLRNNYKLGVDFSVPLLMREARGNVKAGRIKIDQTTLARNAVALSVENKVKAYYNEVTNLRRQLDLYTASAEAQSRLASGERIRFEGGESTLFLMNARQAKLLETTQKLQETRAKLGKAEAGLFWAAGMLQ